MRRPTLSVVTLLIFIGIPTVSHALSCGYRLFTLDEAYEASDSIIVGLITECQEEVSKRAWTSGGDDCSFSTLEVLKESNPPRDYRGIASSSGCGLSLFIGHQYLLFLDSQNQPLVYSSPLSGDQYKVKQAGQYLEALRLYREGVVSDLSEPWRFAEHDGSCSVWQLVKDARIEFRVRTSNAPRYPRPEWIKGELNGRIIYRTSYPLYDYHTKQPSGTARRVSFGSIPDYSENVLTLTISLRDESPAAMRKATILVGERTWALNRMETRSSHGDNISHTGIEYFVSGSAAEQILSAMTKPADLSVSAVLVESGEFEELPADNPNFGLASANSTAESPGRPEIRRHRARRNPPEAELKLESRSTRLSDVIEEFRACYDES